MLSQFNSVLGELSVSFVANLGESSWKLVPGFLYTSIPYAFSPDDFALYPLPWVWLNPESFESSYQGINLWVLLGKPETGGWPFTSWASSLPCTLTSVTVASFCSRWVRPLPLIDGSACLECSSLSPPGSRPQVTSSGPPSLIAYVLFLGT